MAIERTSLVRMLARARAWPVMLAALLLAAVPGASRAGEGIVEINSVCATMTGCFTGDVAGYPVTIGAGSGSSFRLTGDLVVPSSNDDAILIDFAAGSVSIDLNGFEITNAACLHGDCVPPEGAIGMGIGADPQESPRGIEVRNGVVAGMGRQGVRLGAEARVVDLRVRGNGGNGVEVGDGSTVARSIVASNGAGGVDAGKSSAVEACVVRANTDFGIRVAGETQFTDNAIAETVSGPDVDYAGGRDAGPNACGDDSCRSDYRRRFYLTPGMADGAGAAAECAPGFHIASLYEMQNPAVLDYVTTLGLTNDDSGSGAPALVLGWVHAGDLLDGCNGFTSADPGFIGTTALYTSSVGPPVLRGQVNCNFPHRVWCIAD